MALRPLLSAGFLLLLLVVAFTGWAWVHIPDAALIPTHWDVNDQVNGAMHKVPGLLIGPGMMAILFLAFWGIAKIEPRRNNLARSRTLFAVGFLGGLVIVALAQVYIVLAALGTHVLPQETMLPSVALLVILIGNFLGKTRANYFVGMRTPWTLESDYSWEKTNRWAGRFMILSGFATLVAFVTSPKVVAVGVLVGTLLAAAIVSYQMSYVFWKEDPNRSARNSVPE